MARDLRHPRRVVAAHAPEPRATSGGARTPPRHDPTHPPPVSRGVVYYLVFSGSGLGCSGFLGLEFEGLGFYGFRVDQMV